MAVFLHISPAAEKKLFVLRSLFTGSFNTTGLIQRETDYLLMLFQFNKQQILYLRHIVVKRVIRGVLIDVSPVADPAAGWGRGRETWNLCGRLWWPSFLWLIFTGLGGGDSWPLWPPWICYWSLDKNTWRQISDRSTVADLGFSWGGVRQLRKWVC